LNGNNRIAPTSLKITSRVKPMILKGISIIHAKINKKKSPIANGQHRTKRIHQSNNAIIVFMKAVLVISLSTIKPFDLEHRIPDSYV